MKKTKLVSLFFMVTTLFVAGIASAAPMTKAQLFEAAAKGVETFEVENPAHAADLTGWKVWQSGDAARVRVYYTTGGVEADHLYLCELHDTGLDCHLQ